MSESGAELAVGGELDVEIALDLSRLLAKLFPPRFLELQNRIPHPLLLFSSSPPPSASSNGGDDRGGWDLPSGGGSGGGDRDFVFFLLLFSLSSPSDRRGDGRYVIERPGTGAVTVCCRSNDG